MSNSGIGTPYWYEWMVGLDECLKMLTDTEIVSVVLQSSAYQGLDDVVVNHRNGTSTNIQVKHTDVEENMTYSSLQKDDMLKKLALEWKSHKAKGKISSILLVTNKAWGTNRADGKCSFSTFVTSVYPELKNNFDYSGRDKSEERAIVWFKELVKELGEDIKEFIQVFSFRNQVNICELDTIICERIERIIGTSKKEAINLCRDRLYAKLHVWATSLRGNKEEITKEDIYSALCPQEVSLPQYELYPEKPVFPSRIAFAKSYALKVLNSDKTFFFLQGQPGAGKTNFVSYLAQMDNSIVDFRFYTYLPVTKEYASYSDDEGFFTGEYLWKCILIQLKEKFTELGTLFETRFPIAYQYLTVTEMRTYALKYLTIYAERIDRECIVFIDGIDHAARSHSFQNSFLLQLPMPEEIGKGVKFVLVGQPVNDKYPSWLTQNQSIEYDCMPELVPEDIAVLLNDRRRGDNRHDVKSLSRMIVSVAGANALNVLFAIKEVERTINQCETIEKIEEALKKTGLNAQIGKYYEWIVGSISKSVLFSELEAVLAFASRKITIAEMALLCDCREEEVLCLLNALFPLVTNESDAFFVYHNDVRLFFRNEIQANSSIDFISRKLCERITSNEKLLSFQYDVAFGLLQLREDINQLFELVDVKYVMNSSLCEVSYDRLFNQFFTLVQLLQKEKSYKDLPKVSCLSLTLTLFSNSIQFYQKESKFYENQSANSKRKCEKYCLNLDDNLQTIIENIYDLLSNGLKERGVYSLKEYFELESIDDLIKRVAGDYELMKKLGYIWRFGGNSLSDVSILENEEYVDFVEGWVEAGAFFLSDKEIEKTFSFHVARSSSVFTYIREIVAKGIDRAAYGTLKKCALLGSIPISSIVEIGVCGVFNGFEVEDCIDYISGHLELILEDDSYPLAKEGIVGFFKAWFCLYRVVENEKMEEMYEQVLNKLHITQTSRGYKPAKELWVLAPRVYKLFYDNDENEILDEDLCYSLLLFSRPYGTGSCYDCDAYNVTLFFRNVFVRFAKNNPSSPKITTMCNVIMECLKLQKPAYHAEFNELFSLSDDRDSFNEFAEYWCGDSGAAWQHEYSDVEHYCETISKTLFCFGEDEKAKHIMELLQFRLFGYVGHKDYILNELLEYYHHLSLSEQKLQDYGMRLLEVSENASEMGDNRARWNVDKTLMHDAVSLGYGYANALFQLNNVPDGSLVYWRELLLSALYDQIEKINSDDELIALHTLTNAWVNVRIEQDRREYGRLSELNSYNSMILNRVKEDKARNRILLTGNCNSVEDDIPPQVTTTHDYSSLFRMIDEDGYSDDFEDLIVALARSGESSLHYLLIKLADRVPRGNMERFTNLCVVNYIIGDGHRGYSYSGMRDIFERYYPYFSEESWDMLFANIVDGYYENGVESLGGAGDDMEFYTLYYLLKHSPERLEEAFNLLCNTHEEIITANGRLPKKKVSMKLNPSIVTLADLTGFQLNSVLCEGSGVPSVRCSLSAGEKA